jgi:hypothetical protein
MWREARPAPQSDVAKADQALTQALLSGDRAAAEKMLDVDFSWVDPDGVYYATKDEAFPRGCEAARRRQARRERSSSTSTTRLCTWNAARAKRSSRDTFWVQRPAGWRLLHINDLEVRRATYQTVPTTFAVPCTNPCKVLPYRPLGAGEKAALAAWQDQESGGWGQARGRQLRSTRGQHQRRLGSASKADRLAGMQKARLRRIRIARKSAQRRWRSDAGWDFGDAVVWVQLQPTYGDKPYWSSGIYANINGLWQMAESYHTTIKDAPVMAPFLFRAEAPRRRARTDPTAQLQDVLARYWGYTTFRPLQREAMEAILERRDSVTVLPTGGGKSLCFQAPALVGPGLAVVVSPLISLMKDQVDTLVGNGVPAALYNSSLSATTRPPSSSGLRGGTIPAPVCLP